MRPNGRTLRKILMKNRGLPLWGPRAYIRIRLPVSVFPVPPPSLEYSQDWGREVFRGFWKKPLGDGTFETRYIYCTSSSEPPSTEQGSFHFLEALGATRYRWWEGRFSVRPKEGPRTHFDLPVGEIEAHRAWSNWKDTYLHGLFLKDRGPVLQAFLEAGDFARNHDADLSKDGRYLYVTYSAKWLRVESFQRFIADLKRAFRVADKHGVDARVLR